MTAIAIAIVIASSVLHALRDFLTKKSEDKQVFIWWAMVFSMIFTLPIVAYNTYVNGLPDIRGIQIALAIGFVHATYWMFMSKAYDGGDLSHVYPIIRSAPAFILLAAVIFLHEKVSALGVSGIMLIAMGVYVVNLKGFSLVQIAEPLRALRREKHVQFAFLALAMTVIYSIVDKVGVSFVDPFTYAFTICVSASLSYSLYLLKTKPRGSIMRCLTTNTKSIFTNGLTGVVIYPLVLMAMQMSQVSYVVGLRQISVVFAVLFGGKMLKESHREIRLAAAGLIFVGALGIAVG